MHKWASMVQTRAYAAWNVMSLILNHMLFLKIFTGHIEITGFYRA